VCQLVNGATIQWAEPKSERSGKSQIEGEAGFLLEYLEVRWIERRRGGS